MALICLIISIHFSYTSLYPEPRQSDAALSIIVKYPHLANPNLDPPFVSLNVASLSSFILSQNNSPCLFPKAFFRSKLKKKLKMAIF